MPASRRDALGADHTLQIPIATAGAAIASATFAGVLDVAWAPQIARAAIGMLREYEQILRSQARVESATHSSRVA